MGMNATEEAAAVLVVFLGIPVTTALFLIAARLSRIAKALERKDNV